VVSCFFFNDTATTEIYPLSLHDALPICRHDDRDRPRPPAAHRRARHLSPPRSEEHTSELQSHSDLVCRLLLAKQTITSIIPAHIGNGLHAQPINKQFLK